VEVHHDPAHALCDGAQSLDGPQFARLMGQLAQLTAFLRDQRAAETGAAC